MPPAQNSLPPGSQSSFFGQKVSRPGYDVNTASDNELQYTNDYSTETYRDSSGNVVLQQGLLPAGNYGSTYTAANGSVTFGNLAPTGQGMQAVNSAGQLLFEMNGQTWYWYDTSGNTVMMVGYLPIAKIYGWAVAVPGQSLAGVV